MLRALPQLLLLMLLLMLLLVLPPRPRPATSQEKLLKLLRALRASWWADRRLWPVPSLARAQLATRRSSGPPARLLAA